MAIDRRVGQQDYYTRYKVFPRETKIKEYIQIASESIGTLHAKDISSYDAITDTSTTFAKTRVTASIESYDKIVIENGYKLYCIPEGNWYIVDSVSEDSVNTSQRYSKRPIIKKVYQIRKAQ